MDLWESLRISGDLNGSLGISGGLWPLGVSESLYGSQEVSRDLWGRSILRSWSAAAVSRAPQSCGAAVRRKATIRSALKHTHTHTHIYTRTCIHIENILIDLYIHTYMYVRAYIHTYVTYICESIYIHKHTHTHTHMYIYIYTYVCVCIYVCMYSSDTIAADVPFPPLSLETSASAGTQDISSQVRHGYCYYAHTGADECQSVFRSPLLGCSRDLRSGEVDIRLHQVAERKIHGIISSSLRLCQWSCCLHSAGSDSSCAPSSCAP